MPRATAILVGHPKCVNPSTSCGEFVNFMTPLISSIAAIRPLITRPVQSMALDGEVIVAVDCMDRPLKFSFTAEIAECRRDNSDLYFSSALLCVPCGECSLSRVVNSVFALEPSA